VYWHVTTCWTVLLYLTLFVVWLSCMWLFSFAMIINLIDGSRYVRSSRSTRERWLRCLAIWAGFSILSFVLGPRPMYWLSFKLPISFQLNFCICLVWYRCMPWFIVKRFVETLRLRYYTILLWHFLQLRLLIKWGATFMVLQQSFLSILSKLFTKPFFSLSKS